jgi:RNA polymerase sigma factor (TIGR02999 family)
VDEIRKILETVNRTDSPTVSADLLPLVYHELRNLAARQMSGQPGGQTLQPTALVHEAWLRLTKENEHLWNDRAHFYRAAAQAMRHILVDRARAKARMKRGAHAGTLDVHELDLAEPATDERVLLVDEMIERLEKEDPASARVVSLKFFGGLTNKEIAGTEGMGERTVERLWAYARTRLFQMIREETAGEEKE